MRATLLLIHRHPPSYGHIGSRHRVCVDAVLLSYAAMAKFKECMMAYVLTLGGLGKFAIYPLTAPSLELAVPEIAAIAGIPVVSLRLRS